MVGGPAGRRVTDDAAPAIYGLIDRQNLPNLFRTFDFASPDTHSPRRFNTTVPTSALYDETASFCAIVYARWPACAEGQGVTLSARIGALYRLVLGRSPSDRERELGLAFLQGETQPAVGAQLVSTGAKETNAANPPSTSGQDLSAWERYVQVILLSNEFDYVD